MSVITSTTTAAGTETTASRLAVLLFTDIVGSTDLKSRLGAAAYARLLSRHDELFKQSLAGLPSVEVINDTGDGYLVAFATASDAVRFALRMQKGMHDEPWGANPLRVSIGVHLGEITEVADANGRPRVIGLAIDLAGRLTALATAGQILLTRTAFDEARQFLREYPTGVADASSPPPAAGSKLASEIPLRWIAHGDYRFKGAAEPVEVFEVGGEGIAPLAPPPNNDNARRSVSADEEETLGWRPAVGLEVPQRVGWILEQRLGEGTFGEVWLARDEVTKRRSVFKFCFDLQRLQSFKREVTFFRLLRETLGERRDIAQLYDVRLDDPPYFLESEYAPGGNLHAWADAQGGLAKVPLATRLEIVEKVCDAVAAAHSVGILHKDIKPGNILVHVDPDGTIRPQLADFGIGLLMDRKQLEDHHITEIGMTGLDSEQSSRTGTRMYAPPESLKGAPFTTQGDIYALGVLLYQMAVADLERPLAIGWERDVDDELLREDVAACVEGDPSRRLSSASELSKRLRALPDRAAQRAGEHRAAAAVVRRKQLLRAATLLAAACLLITVISVVGYFRERTLRGALEVSERNAKGSEHVAQLRQLENLMTAGDSLVQSRRSAEAVGAYLEAWELAEQLREPTVGPLSGLLQARASSPPPIVGRRPTSQPTGDASPVARVRVAPGGEFLVAGDGGGHAFVIDLASSRIVATLPLKGWGYGIAFAMNGKVSLVGSYDGQLQAWDSGHWDRPREVVQTGARIYAMAGAPDGQSVVCAGAEGSISFWSVAPLKQIRRWGSPAVSTGVLSVAISPDGKWLAAGGKGGSLQLWDIAAGTVSTSFKGHTAEVVGVAFTPDGTKLLSGSYDKTVRLWDVATGKQIHSFAEHRGVVHDVAVSRDGRMGVSASGDETVICWDLEAGRELLRYSRHPKGALSVDFLPDDSAVVSSGENGGITVRPLTADDAEQFKLHEGRIAALCIMPDGLTALSAAWDRTVVQFDLATGRVLRRATIPHPAAAMAIAPDGRTALIGGSNGMLHTLDLGSFALTPFEPSRFGEVRPIVRASGRSITTTTTTTATATTIATAAATSPTSLPSSAASSALYKKSIGAVAISPSGTHALAGGLDQMYSVAPLASAQAGWTLQAGGRVLAACFLPDGKRVVVAVERDLHLLDVATGTVERITTPTKPIAGVAAAPGGKVVATASYDQTIRLWDVDSRISTKTFRGHLGSVRAVAFLPDGKTLVSASEDETVRLWDVTTTREIRSFDGHVGAVYALAVSSDGNTILSGGADTTIRKWDLSRPIKHRAMVAQLANLYSALDANGDDAAALKTLGEWYAFRGRDDWAIRSLERAESGGAKVSPLMMARCYWKLNRRDDAARAFRRAQSQKEAAADYLQLCVGAVSAQPTTGPR